MGIKNIKISIATEVHVDDINNPIDSFLANPMPLIHNLSAEHATTPLTIETYPTDNSELLHPNVIDFYEEFGLVTWNNYRYWLTATPFKDGSNDYENPSIWCSNDGITWVIPAGLTNPIDQPSAAEAANGDYDSDPTLFYDGTKLYCIYRQAEQAYSPARIVIYKMESTDGSTWGNKTTLYNAAEINHIAPTIVQERGGVVSLWYRDNNDLTYPINRKQGTSIDNVFDGTPELCVIDTSLTCLVDKSDHYIWHLEIKKWRTIYLMVAYCQQAYTGLLLFYSTDGINWIGAKTKILSSRQTPTGFGVDTVYWDTVFYKSTFVPYWDNGFKMKLWYTGLNILNPIFEGYSIGFTTIQKNQTTIWRNENGNYQLPERKNELAAGDNLDSPYLFCDTFQRDDTTEDPGVSTCGIDWGLAVYYLWWEVLNNVFIPRVNTYAVAMVDVSKLNVEISMTYRTIINETTVSKLYAGIVLKYLDTDSYLYFTHSNEEKAELYVINLGIKILLTTSEITKLQLNDLNNMLVKIESNRVQVYINGLQVVDHYLTSDFFTSEARMNEYIASTVYGITNYKNINAGVQVLDYTIKEIV